ncbi:MAG TPA: LppP/LprE family lipoprotein [Solirubrobacteraceae bacterium]|nr:LppP/LprE family lipoprotein [Solirubrobacteraceae bacterium]
MIGRAGPLACALALGAMGGALLGGCGGGTQTVSVSGAPDTGGGGAHADAQPSTPAGSTTATGTHTTTPTPTTTTSAGGGTGVPNTTSPAGEPTASTTRTAPAPAFVHPGGQSSEGSASAAAEAAAQAVRAQGYTPESLTPYHPNQTLRVLIGTRNDSTAGYNQRAFFFLDSHYLGTDSSQPSASVRVVGQSDTEVALAYALYRPGDHECCPSGGTATVHFQLNNGQLVPLQSIPPASSAGGLSRQ